MKKIQPFRFVIQTLFLIMLGIGIIKSSSQILSVVTILCLLFGPIFCGFICPFGLLQDLSNKVGMRLGIKQRSISKNIHRLLILLRYILYIFSIATVLDMIKFDPRANLMDVLAGRAMSVGALIIFFVFIGISIFYKRPFCNYFCIEGARYGIIGMARLLRIKRVKDKCINCKLCNKACPMHIDIANNKYVNSLQCVNCYQCISSCPKQGALKIVSFTDMLKSIGVSDDRKKSFKNVKRVAIIISFVIILFSISKNMLHPAFSNKEIKDSKHNIEKHINMKNHDIKNGLDDTIKFVDGVYRGSADGFRGPITTEVTVESGKITSIVVLEFVDDEPWFERAYEHIVMEILKSQSTEVDVVVSATYSSLGIINSVKDALEIE